jgi:hypothetical protein
MYLDQARVVAVPQVHQLACQGFATWLLQLQPGHQAVLLWLLLRLLLL